MRRPGPGPGTERPWEWGDGWGGRGWAGLLVNRAGGVGTARGTAAVGSVGQGQVWAASGLGFGNVDSAHGGVGRVPQRGPGGGGSWDVRARWCCQVTWGEGVGREAGNPGGGGSPGQRVNGGLWKCLRPRGRVTLGLPRPGPHWGQGPAPPGGSRACSPSSPARHTLRPVSPDMSSCPLLPPTGAPRLPPPPRVPRSHCLPHPISTPHLQSPRCP